MKASAVVFAGEGQVEVREVDVPPPGPDEVQVRTTYSAISSGTEGWCLHNKFTWARTPYPCIPGYQRAGIIAAVGSAVKNWAVGERVMATVGVWKGGVSAFWGAHAAVANTPEKELYRIPAGGDDVDASAAVVAQVGYNAAYRPSLQPGDWVVVYGDGLIGQFGAQAARARGARVIVVGHRADRLALAAAHSAHRAVAAGPEAAAQIRTLTGGQPAAVVIDTVQTLACQQEYLPLLEHGRGQIVYSGFAPGDTWANMAWLHQRELTTHYISGWNRPRLEATLRLIAERKMKFRPLITHRVPFTRAPEMYRLLASRSEPSLGIVFDWQTAEHKT